MQHALWLAALLSFASCANAEPPLDPAAATLGFFHADGSVPPPYHTEWRLTVRPDHTATYQHWQGYPGPSVKPRELAFTVQPAQYAALLAALRAAPFADATPPGPAMPGSDTNEITLQSGSRRLTVVYGSTREPQRWQSSIDAFAAIADDAVSRLEPPPVKR